MDSPTSQVAAASPAFVFEQPPPAPDALREAVGAHCLADETTLVNHLLAIAEPAPERAAQIVDTAANWIRRVRALRDEQSSLDAFMHEYDLSSEEGVTLMCLAEALLRIPDNATAEKLIADKLADADWEEHLGKSDSLFVNAGTWGLMLTGRIVRVPPSDVRALRAVLARLVARSSEGVIRAAIRQAMRLMGSQFVIGRSIGEALKRSRSRDQRGYLHSFDMLGEAALTAADAQRYQQAYLAAIEAIGAETDTGGGLYARPGISIKLSALHPRAEYVQAARLRRELTPRVLALALAAKRAGISVCVDAEEADRLELMLDLFAAVHRDAALDGWEGFGLAVQAFGKRALFVIDWLQALARENRRRIPVRLVKGAYWDAEIKRAQELGLPGYPCFTRKVNTDVAYLACARRLLAARDIFYPQLATHNAHTVAAVRCYAAESGDADAGYEFQRLHGMGEALYRVVREDCPLPVRVYAPVGSHADLLPYLVRRLLENGTNTSFVNRIFDETVAPEQLAADPIAAVKALAVKPNPSLPLPVDLFGAQRRNSEGVNLADPITAQAFAAELAAAPAPSAGGGRVSSLLLTPPAQAGEAQPLFNPADHRQPLGEWLPLAPTAAAEVVAAAAAAYRRWNALPVEARAQALERAADRLSLRRGEFIRLLVEEAGKTIADAIGELRETVDFLRYYAAQARRLLAAPTELPGPTGEANELQLHGRGVFVCISPWNFPLSIFTGQIAAALVAGNPVVAKPAEQTPLIAARMVALLREAGVPEAALQCCLGDGAVGAALVACPQVAGVAFTGSVEVARSINRTLAQRDAPIAALIAETGGQNAMIVDSSALPEQVVRDAVASAFGSAGQRCSALRVLYLQEEISDRVIEMLCGAMRELVVGDPRYLATDVGPVIDDDARRKLVAHAQQLHGKHRVLCELTLPPACAHGSYFAPLLAEIPGIQALESEHFGPILHVARYRARDLDRVIHAINATGYGLTLGIHSRIESTWRQIQAQAKVGNVYVNRGMTGAVVGVQPFGGEGLSGTGPKAGGPHYLSRFVTERTLSVNTAAIGGNARLLAASGDP
ncbi:MAG: bifunctional proline dehydrogenase/L-glutamate gamma-semialdehyde dehydrogenase PutA [Gammaproteobacteria bacterium]|nr:bifunctional proline dehydrogenase/L-glutamate gamma-semialdehyde dehydrogenase PutA [Gammaproteobacteria bacterium]